MIDFERKAEASVSCLCSAAVSSRYGKSVKVGVWGVELVTQ